jgi:hypothetical protein
MAIRELAKLRKSAGNQFSGQNKKLTTWTCVNISLFFGNG